MKSSFNLLISLKTPVGYTPFGEFDLGADHEIACNLFDRLEGNDQLDEHCHFHMDLIETFDSIPASVRSKCCNLNELGDNMKLIAREVFSMKNFKE